MRDRQETINQAFGVWAALAGAIFAGAITALFAAVPHWGWIALVVFALLSGIALLSFTDTASRAFLAGTLRKSTYTQIYTTLTRRNVGWVWGKLCDPVEDAAGLPTLFRHALTWRLYDKAMLIAVAYPILLPVGQWMVTGHAARIGHLEFLAPTSLLWVRVAILGGIVLLTLGFRSWLFTGTLKRRLRWAAVWLLFFVGTVAVAAAGAVGGALSGAIATAFLVAGAVAMGAAYPGAVAVTIALTVAVAGALDAAVAIPVALVAAFALQWLDGKDRSGVARWCMTIGVLFAIFASVAWIGLSQVSEERRTVFVFLGVLPLLNALFDTFSYAITLTLMRRGLRSRVPWLWGLLDLAIACILFLALGGTLIAVIHGLNLLAGVPLVDLAALLAGIHTDAGDYVWIYLMLFSTIVPTALHALISLLGVQGLWPRALRRPVAGWVAGAAASPLAALRAALALGVIWTLPLLGLGFILWGLWALGGGVVAAALGVYFDLLLRLAAMPLGAI